MDLKIILIKDPIYKKYKIKEFSDDDLINLFLHFDDENLTNIDFLDSYCPICNSETVFKSIETKKKQEFINFQLSKVSSIHNFKFEKSFIDSFKETEMFVREFSCSRNKSNEHNLTIIFKIIGDDFYKICQFPSIADLTNPKIEKYRKFNIEIYKELNRAIGLSSHGIGVAPFVYLRRILEKHIINPIIQEKIKENTDNKDLILLDFKSKIDTLKNELPNFLTNNPRIYSILSKGIHQLEEQECLEIFPIILNSIELILDEQIELQEKINKELEISKLINNLKI